MDGKNMLRRLEELLDEESTGTWMDDRTSYDFLWEAAKNFVARTAALTNHQDILTVANQPNYVLDQKFLALFQRNQERDPYILFTDGNGDQFIPYRDYEQIKYQNFDVTYDIHQATLTGASTTLQDTGQDFSDWETAAGSNAAYKVTAINSNGTESWAYIGDASTTTNADDTITVYTDLGTTSTGWNGATIGTVSMYRIQKVSAQGIPSAFSIRDKQALYSQVTGTATSDKDAAAGESNLVDTSGAFLTTDYAEAGDAIHNTTDGSTGMVLSITDANNLQCALFGGDDNQWDTDDVYVIQPQGRLELFLDPPPSTSGYIMRVYYIERPDPVYSDYRMYRFRQQAMEGIIKYAAWLYKYRDAEPKFGDTLYIQYDSMVRQEIKILNPFMRRRKWAVNLKKRRY